MSFTYFSNILKLLRKQSGLTQATLAESVCVSVRQIQLLESGRAEPTYTCIINLSKVFNVNPAVFFSENVVDPCYLDRFEEAVHVINDEGVFTGANLAQARMLNTPKDELVGMSVFDFMPVKDEIPSLKKYLKYLCYEKTYPTPYMSVYRCALGNEFPIQVDWNYLFSKEGEVEGFISVVRKLK